MECGALPDGTLHPDIDKLDGSLRWKREDASFGNSNVAKKAAGLNPFRWSPLTGGLSPPALLDDVADRCGASAIQVKGDTFDDTREFKSQDELRQFLACFEVASDSVHWVRSATLPGPQTLRPHVMGCECTACMTVQVTSSQNTYQKIEKVGSPGSFGQVWRATHQSGQYVAIKQINLARYSTPSQRQALDREVSILRELSSTGCKYIVQLREVGVSSAAEVLPGCAPLPKYLILECCASDLAQLIANPLFPAEGLAEHRVKALMVDLARGLGECRQNGIVHHDLKPANLLLVGEAVQHGMNMFADSAVTTSPVVLKIGDFGCAQRVDELTAAGGTDDYTAPECRYKDRRSQAAAPGSSDLWSVGVIFFELLTKSSVPYRKGELREHYDGRSSHSLDELSRRINPARGAKEKLDKSVGGAMGVLRGLLSPHPAGRFSYEEFVAHPWIDIADEPCAGSIATNGGWLTPVAGLRNKKQFFRLAKSNSVDENGRPVYELKCGAKEAGNLKLYVELRLGAYSCMVNKSNQLQIQLKCTHKSTNLYQINADTAEEAANWVRALQPQNLDFTVSTTQELPLLPAPEPELELGSEYASDPEAEGENEPEAEPDGDQKPLRILCIDGGGIKGLTPSLILEKIEQVCSPKRVHELFDLVCGTSTGGIIALGTCLVKVPPAMMSNIYENQAKTIWKARPLGRIANPSAPYDHNGLEDILKQFSVVDGGQQMHMADTEYHKPRVFVVASCRNETFEPFLFRSYMMDPTRGEAGSSGCAVWEAARATSAAPFFFDPISIGGREYFDGGVVANNPVDMAIKEAGAIWPNRPISAVVSLGCGIFLPPKGSDSSSYGNESDASGRGGAFATLQGVKRGLTNTQRRHEQLLRDFHIAHADRSDSDASSQQRSNLCYGGKVVQTEQERLKDCVYLRLNPPLERKVKMQSSKPDDLQLLRRNTETFLKQEETVRRMNEVRELLLHGEDVPFRATDDDEGDVTGASSVFDAAGIAQRILGPQTPEGVPPESGQSEPEPELEPEPEPELKPEPEPELEPEPEPERQRRQRPSKQDVMVAVDQAIKSLTREQLSVMIQNSKQGIDAEWDLVIDSAGGLKAQLREPL